MRRVAKAEWNIACRGRSILGAACLSLRVLSGLRFLRRLLWGYYVVRRQPSLRFPT